MRKYLSYLRVNGQSKFKFDCKGGLMKSEIQETKKNAIRQAVRIEMQPPKLVGVERS